MAYGFMPSVMRQLSSNLNFRMTLLGEPDGSFGAPNENGSWSGLVGSLQRREADICGGI